MKESSKVFFGYILPISVAIAIFAGIGKGCMNSGYPRAALVFYGIAALIAALPICAVIMWLSDSAKSDDDE